MKKFFTVFIFLFLISNSFPQNTWNFVWNLTQLPFKDPQTASELAIVKAGFDTDEDGNGEFIAAYTDYEENYIFMFEATGDNTYEMVWYWKYPVPANSFAGIAVGDIDNSGKVDIVTTMPSVADGTDPNPPRSWVFQWNGVQGENKYGSYSDDTTFIPNNEWNFNLPDNTDFRPYSLQIEDIDNDGKNDLVAGVRSGDRGGEVVVASFNGDLLAFGAWEIKYNLQNLTGGSTYSVTTGDLDNDGTKEIYAFVWNLFKLYTIENFQVVDSLMSIYSDEGIDYGALDAVRVADVNNDGVNELYIAGTEPQNTLFQITNISDVSTITENDVKEFYHIPVNAGGKFRSMQIADPDKDGNLDLMIAGETNGQIFDLEYNGTGDPSDSSSWTLTVAFDLFEYSGISPDDSITIAPRFFYGSPASDMDGDGKDEYVFINYHSNFDVWTGDAYIWMIEADVATSVERIALQPSKFNLEQNYPNPFNPSTTIRFGLPVSSNVDLRIYNPLGEEVAVLINNTFKSSGTYEVVFNAENLTSGTYFYKLVSGNNVETKKMILLK